MATGINQFTGQVSIQLPVLTQKKKTSTSEFKRVDTEQDLIDLTADARKIAYGLFDFIESSKVLEVNLPSYREHPNSTEDNLLDALYYLDDILRKCKACENDSIFWESIFNLLSRMYCKYTDTQNNVKEIRHAPSAKDFKDLALKVIETQISNRKEYRARRGYPMYQQRDYRTFFELAIRTISAYKNMKSYNARKIIEQRKASDENYAGPQVYIPTNKELLEKFFNENQNPMPEIYELFRYDLLTDCMDIIPEP